MKPNNLYLALFISLLFSGCTEYIEVNTPKSNSQSGKIVFKVDTKNAPSNIAIVEATLSRSGYDSIFVSLNLLSDSTAEITINDIQAGIWYLSVNAKDSAGEILFSGETDVEVIAGFIVQVHLTLNPTGLGTGGIYIFVTWGIPSTWSDYGNNPVLSKQNTFFDSYGISQPVVIKDGNQFKMWYLGDAGSSRHFVLYAESADGTNWSRPTNTPVLSPGITGEWDSKSVHPGAILKDGNEYKMYYTGWSETHGAWHVGMATSVDGLNWTKRQLPVLYGGSLTEPQIGATSVLKINDTYFLYYFAGFYPGNWKINLATSTDGINWTRYSGNPILLPTESWEGNGIYYPSVISDGSILRMVYMNEMNTGFGIATSPDGYNWTKNQSNPFFNNNQTANNWAKQYIAYPNFIKSNQEYRIYYAGERLNSVYNSGIGYIKKPVQ